MRADSPVLNEENSPDWPKVRKHGAKYTKFVVGSLKEDTECNGQLPDDLATAYPNLTHLHVWGWSDLTALPQLPPGLVSLDIRKCPNLKSVTNLPSEHLEELVIEDARELTTLPLAATYPNLWDVSIQNCPLLEEPALLGIIDKASQITHLNYSGCDQLKQIVKFPRSADRVDLNRLPELRYLPGSAPSSLRRLGLRDAVSVKRLPSFSNWPDYLDLTGTRSLESMPRPTGGRTLFLHGSGIRVPPSTEHGESPDENVSERTRRYFDDVDLCGLGKVKRAKVLVLGNGSAGKTCLSAALIPQGDPHAAKELRTTHGIQFWPFSTDARVGESNEPVDVQLWDFGGQEIYHHTHRLFMSKGSVFILVWDPDQDGKQPPPTDNGYQDEWRPPQYWIDLIQQACPWNPRIAVVCSKRSARVAGLVAQWENQVEPKWRCELKLHFIDSLGGENQGELADLRDWLMINVGEVIHTQGIEVPAYWEIAQDLVARWLKQGIPNSDGKLREAKETTEKAFQAALRAEITARADDFEVLATALKRKKFALNEDRIERTLGFLTRSGWIYWDPELFERRVIVGQKWALDGIYMALDRDDKSRVYRELRNADGQFTAKVLAEWLEGKAWKTQYTEGQRELILSYMVKIGTCIELVSKSESLWGHTVYKSLQHLPSAKELNLQQAFDRNLDPVTTSVTHLRLHRGHWHAILSKLGDHYGTDGLYAIDGFALENKDGQHVCLMLHFDQRNAGSAGLGGRIEIQVAGRDAQARSEDLREFVASYLPEGAPLSSSSESPPAGPKPNLIRIFVSYAWQPKQGQEDLLDTGVTLDYEAPVNRAQDDFRADSNVLEFLRDRDSIRDGDSIVQFMLQAKSAEMVLVVHSDKYWRSPYCVYELHSVLDAFENSPKNMRENLLFVALSNSRIGETADVDQYVLHWQALRSTPKRLERVGMTTENLRAAAIHLLRNQTSKIHDEGITHRWDPAHPEALTTWLREKLGLKPRTPKE